MFVWLTRIFNGKVRNLSDPQENSGQPPPDELNDTQFLKLQDLHRSLREKLDACADLLEQRIRALKKKKENRENIGS